MKGFKQHVALCEMALDMNAGLAFLDRDLNIDRVRIDPDEILAGHPVRGYISYISEREDPIVVMLSDHTKLYFSLDSFNRIKGARPEKGRWMEAVLQRAAGNRSQVPSRVQSAFCY